MQRRGEESVSFNLCLTLPKSSWGRNVVPLFDYSYLQIEGQISDLCGVLYALAENSTSGCCSLRSGTLLDRSALQTTYVG